MLVRRSLFVLTAMAVLVFQFAGASTLVHGGSAAVPAQSATVFDFTSNVCSAVWWSGAGQLPCPIADHDSRGYVVTVNNPLLEDGTTDSLPGLVVGPQNKTDGYLQGFYPEYTVQPGDHFQTVVGCANGSSCFVTYRLDYRINGGAINILWKWKEANEGRVFNEDFDLTALAGKKVSFILTLLATGSPIGDRAIWGHPHIVGAGAPAPTLTPAPATATSPGPTSSGPTATVPTGSQPPGTVVDFTSNICSAKWWSGAGQLPCPIADHDARGYVVTVNNPLLEDGTTDSLPGLVVGPQNKTDGYLQGFYPEYTVQPGDHFQTVVGCANGSSCFVTYRLDYRINGGAINILWKWKEANEGRVFNEDFDLSALAGKKVSFILTLLATGSPLGDRAIWGHPRIVRAGFVPPTATPIPPPSGFLTYTNTLNGFQFSYPADGELGIQSDNAVHVNLSIVPGTNLYEKYLDAGAVQTSGACSSGRQGVRTQGQVTINGISFLKETGEDGGAGHFHEWTAYSTARDSTCVTLTFFLHWSPAGVWDPPKPEFDRAGESAVFDQIIATFAWVTPQAPGSVTNVTVAADPTFTACGGPNVVDFSGAITTDGPADVTYHWEVGGDANAGTPDQDLSFGTAGTQTVNTDAFKADCGSYFVKLVVTIPNNTAAQANFIIGTQTATPTPQGASATPTPTATVTSVPPTPVPPPAGTAFDFTSNICAAKWWSGAGQLACPMADHASTGYAVVVNNPLLEDGTTDSLPGLIVGPQNKTDGYIQGFYPDYTVQPGDHFQAAVGCANGSSCFVTYRLDYRINGGAINILWSWKEANDNKIFNEDFNLSALAGKKVSFILTLLATGSASGDRAVWGHPRIVHGVAPTPTPVPIPAGWQTFTDTVDGFQFSYPPEGQASAITDSSIHLELPFVAGTTLHAKWLDAGAVQTTETCNAHQGGGTLSTVNINGFSFLKQVGMEGAAGRLFRFTSYSTARGDTCVVFDFILRSIDNGALETPLPDYDVAAESVIFGQIMSTFQWPAASATSTPPPAAAQCELAIGDGSALVCRNGSSQLALADTSSVGTISLIRISSDGRLVAYTVTQSNGAAQLWTVNADGSNAHKLVGPDQLSSGDPSQVNWPRDIQWQAATHKLFFDTGSTPAGGGPGEILNADLWKVDADSGSLVRLLAAGSAGSFSVSPNGQWVAVSRVTDIGLISTGGGSLRSGLLTFPSIMTYSEFAYRPGVSWSPDGSFFTAAIPSPDPLAADSSAAIYRVGVDGTTLPLLTLPGNFVISSALMASPDAQSAAYVSMNPDGSNATSLYVTSMDGSTHGGGPLPAGSRLIGWSPNSTRVAYAIPNDGIYVAGLDGLGQLLAPQQAVRDFDWTGGTAALFSGLLNGRWAVRTAQVGGGFAELAGPFSQMVVFGNRE